VTAAGSPGDLSSGGDATPSWAESTAPRGCEENNYYSPPAPTYRYYSPPTPGYYEESCNTSQVNTHWTPEWNATSSDTITNATKGEGDELLWSPYGGILFVLHIRYRLAR